MTKKVIFLTVALLTCSISLGQNSYQVLFATGLDESINYISKGYEDEYLITKYKSTWGGIHDTNSVSRYDIYSFYNNLEDSLHWSFDFYRTDTNIFPKSVIFDSNYYFVFGAAVTDLTPSDSIKRFEYMAKFDINKNLIWEKFYQRPSELNEFRSTSEPLLLKLISGNILKITETSKIASVTKRLLITEYKKDGTIVKERILSDYLTGDIQSLTYDFDSSAILLHSTTGHIPGCNYLYTAGIGALVLDTATYDTIGGVCYAPGINIQYPYEAKFDHNGHLILSGNFWTFDFDHEIYREFMETCVLNSDFQVINRKVLSDEDRRGWPGERRCMDISPEGNIYVAGVVDWIPVFWPQQYNYIYVSKTDSNLNLISERYFGGDTFYHVMTMKIATDGGVLLGGKQYDYTVNNYEKDAFLIKTDPDLWVNTTRHNSIPVHSALVYPNPGNKNLYVRTTEKGSVFILYNLSGKQIRQTIIKHHVTELDCSSVEKGVYVWKLFKNNRETDYGKWIKIN